MSAATFSSHMTAAREGYWWINAIGIGLTIVIASMSIHAYGATGQQDKAAVCVICQLIAIGCAVLARRALMAGQTGSAIAALAFAVGAAWWASKGLALAWARDGQAAEQWMVLFLTLLEPSLFLLAEHVRDGRREQMSAQARAKADEDAEAQARRERDRIRALSTAGAAALAVMSTGAHASAHMGASGHMGAHMGAQMDTVSAHVDNRAPIVDTNTGHANAREHAQALALRAVGRGEQPSATAIAQSVGKPRSTVARWIADVGGPPVSKRKRATA